MIRWVQRCLARTGQEVRLRPFSESVLTGRKSMALLVDPPQRDNAAGRPAEEPSAAKDAATATLPMQVLAEPEPLAADVAQPPVTGTPVTGTPVAGPPVTAPPSTAPPSTA